MKRKIGLFFGSFNPIHTGHLIIANLVHTEQLVDEVWFIVSPQNPHKQRKNLLHEQDRLDLVREAIKDDYFFQASDIEFGLPRPSYTVNTLAYLEDKYPQHDFRLIIGEDNLSSFTNWKNHQVILEKGLIVYPRPNANPSELKTHEKVQWVEAPKIDISATLIRKLISEGKSIKYLVPESVAELIDSRKFYQ
jgi:nicotinate-nucleotide adenylyltransferase